MIGHSDNNRNAPARRTPSVCVCVKTTLRVFMLIDIISFLSIAGVIGTIYKRQFNVRTWETSAPRSGRRSVSNLL